MKNKGLMFGLMFCIFSVLFFSLVSAEKLNIEVGNNYIPGDEVEFKIILYNDNNEQISGQIDYMIRSYYSDIEEEGIINSGEQKRFRLLKNAWKGPWEIIASHGEVKAPKTLFNVGELESADIRLEGDSLTVENIGNVAYDKDILIYIGNNDQTAQVFLEIGQTKVIKLTAPEGTYKVRVVSEDANFEVDGVSLTGNVVGLERVIGESFWQKYPLVSLFLIAIVMVIVVVFGLKGYDKFTK